MILYSIRSMPFGYMIAKFDEDFNVAETYELSDIGTIKPLCSCPNWPRKQKCKHTKMLSRFIEKKVIDSDWFYDYDKGDWHQPLAATADQVASLVEAKGPTETLPSSLPVDHANLINADIQCSRGDSPKPATFRRRV